MHLPPSELASAAALIAAAAGSSGPATSWTPARRSRRVARPRTPKSRPGAAAPSAPTRRPHSTRLQRVAEPRCGYSPGSSPPASPTVRELPYLEEPPELARSFGGSGAGAAVDGRPTAAARVWVAAARPQYPNGVYRGRWRPSRGAPPRGGRPGLPPGGPRRPVSLAAKTSATWFERSGSLAPGGACHTAYRKSCYYPTPDRSGWSKSRAAFQFSQGGRALRGAASATPCLSDGSTLGGCIIPFRAVQTGHRDGRRRRRPHHPLQHER